MKFKIFSNYPMICKRDWREYVARLKEYIEILEKAGFKIVDMYAVDKYIKKKGAKLPDSPYIVVEVNTLEDLIRISKLLNKSLVLRYHPDWVKNNDDCITVYDFEF